MRKKMIILMFVLYLMALPPFITAYNRNGFCLGLPTFLFGLLAISLGMVLVTFLLYHYEENNKKDGDQK